MLYQYDFICGQKESNFNKKFMLTLTSISTLLNLQLRNKCHIIFLQ